MWREGFSLGLAAWGLNALALAFGALLGVRALIDPNWAAKLVRLQPDEQGGGFAEFRATFGGVFFGLHAIALIFSVGWIVGGDFPGGLCALGASSAVAAGWFGAAAGRVLSMRLDKTATPFNRLSAVLECAIGALIAGPLLLWALIGFG